MEVAVRASSWEPEAKGSNVHTSTIDENSFHDWDALRSNHGSPPSSLFLCVSVTCI
jgi:hypothetical protein